MSKLDELIRELCPNGVEKKNWVILLLFQEAAIFKRKTLDLLEYHVFTMDKSILAMGYLPTVHLLTSVRSVLKSKKWLKK